MLARARRRDRDRALDLCRRHPTYPTQIAAWIHEGGLEGQKTAGILFIDTSGGLAFVSELGVVMPYLDEEASIEALARWLGPLGARVVVGPRRPAEILWRHLEASGIRTRISRDQVSYAVTRAGFRAPRSHRLNLRAARAEDLEPLLAASAAMAIEESRDDPASRAPELFRRRIERRVAEGRDFVLFENGQLVFKANVAASSPHGGHIEGVYTAPHARGRGLGTAGTAWVTRWILERAPAATLLVNADNAAARRIYERIGYVQQYDSRTFLAA